MVNLLLWVTMILATFSLILIGYRLFGLYGLYAFAAVALVIANIQVLKRVEIMGFAASFGAIVFSATFLTTDIISEIYGKSKAKIAVAIGFFTMFAFLVLGQLSLAFAPAANDWAHPHLMAILSILPRITIASLSAYLLSNFHDVWAYQFWRKKFPSTKQIWIRNNASTIMSQMLDSAAFSLIAFAGIFPLPVVFQIAVTTYLFKVIIAVCDTPFVYLARWMRDNNYVGLMLNSDERDADSNISISNDAAEAATT